MLSLSKHGAGFFADVGGMRKGPASGRRASGAGYLLKRSYKCTSSVRVS
jgi:hypothetical protein